MVTPPLAQTGPSLKAVGALTLELMTTEEGVEGCEGQAAAFCTTNVQLPDW